MRQLLVLFVFAVFMSSAMAVSYGTIGNNVVYTSNYQNFNKKFCSVSSRNERIFILPAHIFRDYKSITCRSGTFRLRMNEHREDAGHYIYNIDPPRGVANAFDCDGKADIGMKVIAINCYPVRSETVDHPRT